MIQSISVKEAQQLFDGLPVELRATTLSPVYVVADAVRDSTLKPIFLCYREGASYWLHSAHLGQVPGEIYYDLQSAYGYGGPVGNDMSASFIDKAANAFRDWSVANNILAEFVRLHPLILNDRFFRGRLRDDRETIAIPLNVAGLEEGYAARTRRGIRKANRAGVQAEWRDQIAISTEFPSFYRAAMRALGAKDFYLFSDEYFAAIAALPESRLLVCHLDGVVLSMGIFFWGESVVEYHLGATAPLGRELYSAYLMFGTAAAAAQADRKMWLYLGGGTDSDPSNSLLHFKAGYSATRFPFRIGSHIFSPIAYQDLMVKKGRTAVDRVLFYR